MSLRPILDLTKYHFRHERGEIAVIGTWYFDADNAARSCLALVPTGKEGPEKVTPCIVPSDRAYLWSEDPFVGNPRHVAHACVAFAQALGMDANSPFTCMKIATAVRDHVGDLLRIPPRPNYDSVVTADAIITNRDTGKVTHKEITDVR